MRLTKRKRKKMYITSIDASKAFDKVNRNILFHKLYEIAGHTITTSLMAYYSNTKAFVLNNNIVSNIFTTTIGVKQGGSLSPRLFSLYIEEIIEQIDLTNHSYKLKNMIISSLLYADDIILISNTKRQLQEMLNTVSKIGLKLQIKFNPGKTNFMPNERLNVKSKQYYMNDKINLKLDGLNIENLKEFRYLDNMINRDLKNTSHLNNRIIKTKQISQKIVANGFLKFSKPETLAQLHKTYIRPVLYYGLEAIFLSIKEKNPIKSYEAKNIKIGLGLSPRLQTKLFMHSLGIDDFSHRFKIIKLNFYNRLINND